PQSLRHPSINCGPAARWIAPSTPPPPSSVVLAAFTIASTSSLVMSPRTTATLLSRAVTARDDQSTRRRRISAYNEIGRASDLDGPAKVPGGPASIDIRPSAAEAEFVLRRNVVSSLQDERREPGVR